MSKDEPRCRLSMHVTLKAGVYLTELCLFR